MQLGPGVYVGPVFIVLGLALVLLRHPVGQRLAKAWPGGDLSGPRGAVVLGASSMVAGGVGILAGLGLMEWWPG